MRILRYPHAILTARYHVCEDSAASECAWIAHSLTLWEWATSFVWAQSFRLCLTPFPPRPRSSTRAQQNAVNTDKVLFTLLDLRASSLRRGHANLRCIVPILTEDPRKEPNSYWSILICERNCCRPKCMRQLQRAKYGSQGVHWAARRRDGLERNCHACVATKCWRAS